MPALASLFLSSTRPRSPHEFIPPPKAGGSGRPPRDRVKLTALPAPDPLQDLRDLAAAQTIDEARAIWSERIKPAAFLVRRLAVARFFGSELVDVARLIEASPLLATKDAAKLRNVVVAHLASLLLLTAEATVANEPKPARSKGSAKARRKKD